MVKRKKGKLKIGNIIIFSLIIILVFYVLIHFIKFLGSKIIDRTSQGYISSTSEKVKLYNLEFKETTDIARGTKVLIHDKEIKNDDSKTYKKIKYDKKEYLINTNNIALKYEDSIKEERMYVRTPVTIYKNENSSDILSMAKKGEELKIIGFDKIDSDGKVNMYKIEKADIKGFVYAKYLVNSKEQANKNYDENNSYQVHLKRDDTLGGGAAKDLDFYPVDKPKFKNNKMPDEVRSLYLNSGVLGNLYAYIKLAKNSNINAFVVDIKDNTAPGYASNVMKELSPTNYERAINSFDNYKKAIQKIKDEGFYVIGRITVFKDSYYVTDNPDCAITSKSTNKPYSHNGSYWPSAYSRDVWEFNVKLAIEAVREMGFNEIQFDYSRFPDKTNTIEQQGLVDMKNKYNESKAGAIQSFLMYATDEIHKEGAYVSVDVFGESANSYVTAYGQYWGAISNVVDVISAMPYPDHFDTYAYGSSVPVWTEPYKLLKAWGETVVERQNEIPTPAICRTWIQAYNTVKSPYITYDASKISDQIKALYDNGLTGGYITWNASSSITKYQEIASSFKKDYKK